MGDLKPMRANPGGEIAPEYAVGRGQLVKRLWETIRNQSVVMVAERRIGKTTTVKKMRAETPSGMRLIYRDVEGISTPLEFAESVARDVEASTGPTSAAMLKIRRLLTQLAGAEVGGVLKFPPEIARHWKTLLESAVGTLTEDAPTTTYVFTWDELPLMLDNVRRTSGEETAMEILDCLRSLRQAHSNLRMIFTGSVGLHHVLTRLRDEGHLNDATNDMRTMEITPLSPQDGCDLARALILGEGLECGDLASSARVVSDQADHIPFYIHHIVARMRDLGDVATEELALRVVREALMDAHDIWHLEHFRARLDERYGADKLPVVLAILDHVAVCEEPVPLAVLSRHIRSTLKRPSQAASFVGNVIDGDDEALRRLLDLLQRDHYLRREGSTLGYEFRFSLIRQWWKLHRSLA